MSFDHTIYARLLMLEGKVQRLEKIIVEQTMKELGVTASELRRELMHVVPAEAGGEKVAGGSTREDEKAVEAAGDKGPVTVNSPATDPIRDAVATARGRVLVVDDIPMLNKLAAMMSPATDAAPAVCVWTRLDPNRVDYRIACAPDPSTIYHPHPQRLASANCANCGKPITFTEANHG